MRRPARDQLLYERRNGSFVLQVTGHPEFGLPFGQDRLVPIFLATMAVKERSPTIRFRSASVLLDWFGLSRGGKEYRRLVAAFERIFGATIFFGTDTTSPTARLVHRARFSLLREAHIWYNRRVGLLTVIRKRRNLDTWPSAREPAPEDAVRRFFKGVMP